MLPLKRALVFSFSGLLLTQKHSMAEEFALGSETYHPSDSMCTAMADSVYQMNVSRLDSK